jgi:hypothetical protein
VKRGTTVMFREFGTEDTNFDVIERTFIFEAAGRLSSSDSIGLFSSCSESFLSHHAGKCIE